MALLLPTLVPLTVIVVNRPVLSELKAAVTRDERGVAWGDKVYTNREDLERFLRSRGRTYETWAKNHPRAAPWDEGARIRDAVAAWAFGTALAILVVATRRPAPPKAPPRQHPAAAGSGSPLLRAGAHAAYSLAAAAAGMAARIARTLDDRNVTRTDVTVYLVAAASAFGAGVLVVAMLARA